MYASLTVVTHPARRAVSALRAARRCADAALRHPALAFARPLQTATFRADTRLPHVPGRVAVMLWATDEGALDDAGGALLAPLEDGARERWRVVLRPVTIHGDWAGFAPTPPAGEPALLADEPVAVMIHGLVKPRHLVRFVRENAHVGAQLARAAGYLGGVGLAHSFLDTTSFSCWRTAADSRRFAFAAGSHRDAYKAGKAAQWHSTEFWVRFRPLRSEGTFEGRDPFAGVLRAAVPAGAAVLPAAVPSSSVPA